MYFSLHPSSKNKLANTNHFLKERKNCWCALVACLLTSNQLMEIFFRLIFIVTFQKDISLLSVDWNKSKPRGERGGRVQWKKTSRVFLWCRNMWFQDCDSVLKHPRLITTIKHMEHTKNVNMYWEVRLCCAVLCEESVLTLDLDDSLQRQNSILTRLLVQHRLGQWLHLTHDPE